MRATFLRLPCYVCKQERSFSILLQGMVMSVFHQGIIYLWSFKACYIRGQCGEFTVKNVTFTLLVSSCCFLSKNLYFYHFHLFVWWSIECPQQNINQLKTGIGDKKLSVEHYVIFCMGFSGNNFLSFIYR